MNLAQSEIIEIFTDKFSNDDNISFVYLFGSQAKNHAGKLSDIDIAVYLDEKLNSDKQFAVRLELMNQTIQVLRTDKIDLIVLNNSPLLLSFRVIHDGILIFSKDEKKRIQFETRTMSLYFDQQYYYQRHARLTMERIAEEGIL